MGRISMKTLRMALVAGIVTALCLLILSIPALGGQSLGLVGGWVWKAMWSLLGITGVLVMLVLGGAYTVQYFWKRARERGIPAG